MGGAVCTALTQCRRLPPMFAPYQLLSAAHALEDDAEYPDLPLDRVCLPCQSFMVHRLHQMERGDEVFTVLPPSFGQGPLVSDGGQGREGVQAVEECMHTALVTPGGTRINEHPALTCITTSTLEAEASECRLTLG